LTISAYLALSRYSPERVSIFRMSPSLMKRGTWITRPVERVAGLVAPVAVSPFQPGSLFMTSRLTVVGKSKPMGRP
jgi:hypothetical protein